jgi:hypothetical protein
MAHGHWEDFTDKYGFDRRANSGRSGYSGQNRPDCTIIACWSSYRTPSRRAKRTEEIVAKAYAQVGRIQNVDCCLPVSLGFYARRRIAVEPNE